MKWIHAMAITYTFAWNNNNNNNLFSNLMLMLLPPDAFMFNFRFVCSSISFSHCCSKTLSWMQHFSDGFSHRPKMLIAAFRFGFEWKIMVFPNWTTDINLQMLCELLSKLWREFMIYGHWHITSSTALQINSIICFSESFSGFQCFRRWTKIIPMTIKQNEPKPNTQKYIKQKMA